VLSLLRAKHTLPDISYDYGALEPVISAEIMKIHHQKHHAAYVNNLNVAEEKLAEAKAKSKFIWCLVDTACLVLC
jgi:Fe-Mn family superoxide dismutase